MWVDNRKEKSYHKQATPTCGGLAIAFSWFLGITYFFFQGNLEKDLYQALLLGIPLVFLGFLDDLYNLKQRFRLLVQMGAVASALYILGGLQQIDLGIAAYQNPYFLNTLAFVGITWVMNLYNFQDGIDGYAATEAIFLSLAGFFLFNDSLLLALACSVLGFVFWNWEKAKIFMGDTGSLFLGYTLSIFAIHYQNQGSSILVFVILFTAFWCDSTATLIRDLWNKEDIMKRHKRFVFHKLVSAGWSHQQVVLAAMGFNLVLFTLALASKRYNLLFQGFVTSLVLFFIVMKTVDSLQKKTLRQKTSKRKQAIFSPQKASLQPKMFLNKNYPNSKNLNKNMPFLKKPQRSQRVENFRHEP